MLLRYTTGRVPALPLTLPACRCLPATHQTCLPACPLPTCLPVTPLPRAPGVPENEQGQPTRQDKARQAGDTPSTSTVGLCQARRHRHRTTGGYWEDDSGCGAALHVASYYSKGHTGERALSAVGAGRGGIVQGPREGGGGGHIEKEPQLVTM